mmetsp:Transcript_67017/g.132145  ORF Transcript_67017/g.132145 Transcript_67017/m.132145 type:complete len:500 (+) Transcript_67017:61-1560(+)|eukprot:CAMPEP_0172720768 /NCGR_PEP_ID=MMETSP1074-20121228/77622_1 /TAXON_ID=2916 /ORGANISM="Ceratium fusus, Strain PA161109" /LENGTH=499 /DNA_ID=CAMNT_0013546345 /DNA_START=57 /DNA_END=1556 /DNA_ORIENTATION=-
MDLQHSGRSSPAWRSSSVETATLDVEHIRRQGWLSDRANMDVLKMEQAIEQNLSKAMTGLCGQFSQQLVDQNKDQQEQLQGADACMERTLCRAEVLDNQGQKQLALLQQLQNQQNNDVSSLRMEVENLRQDLHKISGHASSSDDFDMANAVGDKVCRDVQVLFNAFQTRMSSEVCDALGQLRGEFSLVKSDVARTNECLQHVEGEVRTLAARPANEHFTARLKVVEDEVRRSSNTLTHVGNILNVTHEITTGSDNMIERMSYEVSNWREAESRLEKRLLTVEQMLQKFGALAVNNAEQQFEMRRVHEAEQVKDGDNPKSADLRHDLEALIGKMNETLQTPQPKRTSVAATSTGGLQQQSPIGSYTRIRSPTGSIVPIAGSRGGSLILGGRVGVQGGMPFVARAATSPSIASSSRKIDPSSPHALVVSSGKSDLSFAISPTGSKVGTQVSPSPVPTDASRPSQAGIHPHYTSVGGYSVVPRQVALSAMPVAQQAQQPHGE